MGIQKKDFEIVCISDEDLDRFLNRRFFNFPTFYTDITLRTHLETALVKANELVPSNAGSILLDDPLEKNSGTLSQYLYFITAFGEMASKIVGKKIPANKGIAGEVYTRGVSYLSDDPQKDSLFFKDMDEELDYSTKSLIAVPIRIGKKICGVLELVNRVEGSKYSSKDLQILEIFADYISLSIENALDAKFAQELAKKDDLTGLYNDRFLHIKLSMLVKKSLASNEDLSLAFLDLDDFKLINDSFGHLVGSKVLKEIGWILRKISNEYGLVAARYGGDEFVIIMPEVHLERAREIAEFIRQTISSTELVIDSHGKKIPIKGLTASLGVTSLQSLILEEAAETLKDQLLRFADFAMYQAKERGKNTVIVASVNK